MKLATYRTSDKESPRFGVVMAGQVLDVARAGGPSSLKEALAIGLDQLRALVAGMTEAKVREFSVPEAQVSFLPPVPDPGKFLCVGKNYKAHLEELVRTDLIREMPEEPTGFVKLNATLVGQDAEVARPEGIVQFDYEPELVFVIGKPAYRVPAEEAMSYVAGITAFNDLTAREIQKREVKSGTRFWTAKNMPGFGPIGPFIVTLDEVSDVNDLWLTCSVNGSERLRFSTSGMINKIPDIIAHFSRYIPLEPGDLFATGSPGGVAVAQADASSLFLKPGDTVTVGIESYLSLRTRIV